MKRPCCTRCGAECLPWPDGVVALIGPSGTVLDIVRSAMASAASALSELATDRRGMSAAANWERLQRAASGSEAWVETFLDCYAVTRFDIDGEAAGAPS